MTINGQIILHFSNSALLYFVIIGGNVLEQFSIECRKITKDKDNAKKKFSEPVTIGFFVETLKTHEFVNCSLRGVMQNHGKLITYFLLSSERPSKI